MRSLADIASSVPGATSPVDRILSDHEQMRPLLRAALAEPGTNTQAQAQAILAILGPHAAFEEQVYAGLKSSGDRWTLHVLAEHPDLEKSLKAAIGGDAAALRYAADLGLGHFDEEEAFVLPRLTSAPVHGLGFYRRSYYPAPNLIQTGQQLARRASPVSPAAVALARTADRIRRFVWTLRRSQRGGH